MAERVPKSLARIQAAAAELQQAVSAFEAEAPESVRLAVHVHTHRRVTPHGAPAVQVCLHAPDGQTDAFDFLAGMLEPLESEELGPYGSTNQSHVAWQPSLELRVTAYKIEGPKPRRKKR